MIYLELLEKFLRTLSHFMIVENLYKKFHSNNGETKD